MSNFEMSEVMFVPESYMEYNKENLTSIYESANNIHNSIVYTLINIIAIGVLFFYFGMEMLPTDLEMSAELAIGSVLYILICFGFIYANKLLTKQTIIGVKNNMYTITGGILLFSILLLGYSTFSFITTGSIQFGYSLIIYLSTTIGIVTYLSMVNLYKLNSSCLSHIWSDSDLDNFESQKILTETGEIKNITDYKIITEENTGRTIILQTD